MKKHIKFLIVGSAALFASACTDLETQEIDSLVIQEKEFQGVNAGTTLDGLYGGMSGQNASQQNVYALSEGTTDELFIPTRGTDWGDNGVWRDLARHAWTPAHAYNRATWDELNGNIYTTNAILHAKTPKTPVQEGEARFLRAFNMFRVVDFWRQVPFREADADPEVLPSVMEPEAAINMIIEDLNYALDDRLPAVNSGDITNQARASKAAAHMLLAKVYLNRHIYLGAEEPSNEDMNLVIQNVDAITAMGYAVQPGFFSIFSPSADSETIWYLNAQYGQRIWGSLHYFQGKDTDIQDGGWNGFATTADFYNKFQQCSNCPEGAENALGGDQEERAGYVPTTGLGIGFLIGQQYGPYPTKDDAPVALKQRNGAPLIFTPDVPTLTGNGEAQGIRLLKYHPIINMPGTWGNHLIVFRYADALLMKAEALMRKTPADEAGAMALVNQLRAARVNTVPIEEFGATAEEKKFTLDDILDERGRELYIEGWRRNDLVRFGKFNTEFGFVENTAPHTAVFPIPDNALGANPNLKQNPGY